ncbi:hypothetical protein N657DRAFT_649392 [Parathielavia appendiculata]|uniref:Uncharacterized protein n=1 Tax=Parathielavia appendiculata TaxID=2587402 RepID=A0AAN6TSS6_9PEZI|nr:hypothetical protein N657DRAFT_649392 [Parathielavia appendiculata]
MSLTKVRTFDQKMAFIPQVIVIILIRRYSSIRREGPSSTGASPTYARPLRRPLQQEYTVSSVICAILTRWFGTTPRTSTTLKIGLVSRPMCERAGKSISFPSTVPVETRPPNRP